MFHLSLTLTPHISDTSTQCHGIIREFAEEVIYIFSQRFLEPKNVCTLLQLCSPPTASALQPSVKEPFNSKEQPKGGKSSEIPIKTREALTGTFVHISDIHFDERYLEGASAECAQPLCCRLVDGKPESGQRAAGYWGDYKCDVPFSLLNSLLATLDDISPRPDFLIYTG